MIAAVYRVYTRPPHASARPSLEVLVGGTVVSPIRAIRFVIVSLIGLMRVIGFVAVPTGAWLATSKRARGVRVSLAALATFQIASFCREMPRTAERARLVRAVDVFHQIHGRYPTSLEEAGVTPDPAVFERCDYYVAQDPTAAYLELSDGFLSTHWDYDFQRDRWESYHD